MKFEDLVQTAGVPGRTIRYWISEGMVPPAEVPKGLTTREAEYGEAHLRAIAAIKLLQGEGLVNAEIRDRLEHGYLDELEIFPVVPGLRIQVVRGLLPQNMSPQDLADRIVGALRLAGHQPKGKREKSHANVKAKG